MHALSTIRVSSSTMVKVGGGDEVEVKRQRETAKSKSHEFLSSLRNKSLD